MNQYQNVYRVRTHIGEGVAYEGGRDSPKQTEHVGNLTHPCLTMSPTGEDGIVRSKRLETVEYVESGNLTPRWKVRRKIRGRSEPASPNGPDSAPIGTLNTLRPFVFSDQTSSPFLPSTSEG